MSNCGTITCPLCGAGSVVEIEYDYGRDRETGYLNAGVRLRCESCKAEWDDEGDDDEVEAEVEPVRFRFGHKH